MKSAEQVEQRKGWGVGAVVGFVLLVAGCGGANQNQAVEAPLAAQCDTTMEQCKARCKQEQDVAAQSACLSGCMQALQRCQGGR